MIKKMDAIPKVYIDIGEKDQYIIFKKITYCILIISLFVCTYYFISFKLTQNSDFSSDLYVAEFRTDINKLMEVSQVIYSTNNANLPADNFGTEGDVLKSSELNPTLIRVLTQFADIDGDKTISEKEVTDLGIKHINKNLYMKELVRLQYNHLSTDNNLKHYVIITKGKLAGTILYNGSLKFTNSNRKSYVGLDIFEQL